MRSVNQHRWIGVLAVLLVVAAACGSSGDGDSSNTTTTVQPDRTTPYAKPGPYAVGYTNLAFDDGRQVMVWYPVTEGDTKGHAPQEIDIAGFLNAGLQAKIPPDDRVKYAGDAYLDAPARPQKGGYPVVLFSHGYAGFPAQSISLTTHLASWGYVVAAPDHVERSLDGILGDAAKGVTKSEDPAVLSATLDLIEAQSNQPDTLLSGTVNPDEVAAAGHSAGASAAYLVAASDPRIKGWISYSVGFGGKDGKAEIPAPADKPGMVELGTKDGIIPPARSKAVYAQMHDPKYLVQIAGAGHLVFSDLCLIGSDKGGLVQLVKTLQLPIPPELLKLASDGCGPSYPPVEKAFPAIDQSSVAFLRWVFGQDPQPVGLTTKALTSLGAPVSVTEN